ncbi:MAG: toxin-antitoxin system HicB family antitoxin [Lachnospiraceae bacterium]|nr:toxin-antitoxin system HicB family antitoxin [Lachnospiraceae bacterium]
MKFKINKTEYINRTFRIPKCLSEMIARRAQDANVSSNEFVIQALKFALKNLDEQE